MKQIASAAIQAAQVVDVTGKTPPSARMASPKAARSCVRLTSTPRDTATAVGADGGLFMAAKALKERMAALD